ncbi:M23 family metallopeptidase [Sphingosinicella sp. BN140058]|uniref:M23 family metallopeptidase n=1 Tax=Sphingosinicella sp. BN140058 TaxID=1892855 RepID=UPI0013EB0972|nr:M23 family metallopeptidase [Sphingosinicella sp. BN140058]
MAAFAPAKWPAVAAISFPQQTPGRSYKRATCWGTAALFGTVLAVALAASFDGPAVATAPILPHVAALPEVPDALEAQGTTLLVGLVPGERIARALGRAGVAASEAAAAERTLEQAIFTTMPAAGTELRLQLGEQPSFLASRPLRTARFVTATGARLTLERAGSGFRLRADGPTASELPRRFEGPIGGDLVRALCAAGVTPRAATAFLAALRSRRSADGFGNDDRFLAVTDYSGALLLARIDRADGRGIALMPWTFSDGRTIWLDANGAGTPSKSQRPVPGPVSSGFGSRLHPILGFWRMHKGMDFRAAAGTPIVATMDGRVSAAGWHGGYGRQVRVDHPGGLASSYSHMREIAVTPGTLVRQGQLLGYVGSSGLSTGPHLHFELLRGGVPVDPLSIVALPLTRLTGEDLATFRERMRQLATLPAGAAPAAQVRAADAGTSLRL